MALAGIIVAETAEAVRVGAAVGVGPARSLVARAVEADLSLLAVGIGATVALAGVAHTVAVAVSAGETLPTLTVDAAVEGVKSAVGVRTTTALTIDADAHAVTIG